VERVCLNFKFILFLNKTFLTRKSQSI
jgi:hypothetical protein